MNEKIKKILTEVKKYLIESFGDKIRQVILYGSYARGITMRIQMLRY